MEQGAAPTIWRTKLRSKKAGVSPEAQVAYCLKNEVVGIGWWADSISSGSGTRKLNDLCRSVERNWQKSAADTIRRFATQVRPADFIWARDTNGDYLLGRFKDGPWSYLNPNEHPEVGAVDLQQQRPVEWLDSLIPAADVPGGVIRSFVGSTSSFQRINSDSTRQFVENFLWPHYAGQTVKPFPFTPETALRDHLDMYEVEDLIFIWLQEELGYLILPSSREKSKPVFEWEMVHRMSGHSAFPQIKTGDADIDWAKVLAATINAGDQVLVFRANGAYPSNLPAHVRIITHEELAAFAMSPRGRELLPERITRWFG